MGSVVSTSTMFVGVESTFLMIRIREQVSAVGADLRSFGAVLLLMAPKRWCDAVTDDFG